MTKKKKPSVLARLERSRKRLEGRADELQAWFRGEIHERTGWSPGKSTVHRYVHGQASLDERAERVLEELEAEAEKVGPWEPPAALELPELGAELERNVLLLADFINGATYEELSEAFGISETRAGSIVQRAGVRRLADLA